MKNKKIFIIIVIIILVLCIAAGIIFSVKNNKRALFIHSHKNYNSGTNYGYIIYSDGTIEEYEGFNYNKELKNKLTKSELNELKELANNVQDKFEVYNDMWLQTPLDVGTTVNEIYNDKLNNWIILDKSGGENGGNNSEESKRIKELVDMLYEKYIK